MTELLCHPIHIHIHSPSLYPHPLQDLGKLFSECVFESEHEKRRLLAQLRSLLVKVEATYRDVDGFARICSEVQLHWLKVRFQSELPPCPG